MEVGAEDGVGDGWVVGRGVRQAVTAETSNTKHIRNASVLMGAFLRRRLLFKATSMAAIWHYSALRHCITEAIARKPRPLQATEHLAG